MSREYREVKDDWGNTTYILYCNTVDLYVTSFDFDTRETLDLFSQFREEHWQDFEPNFQGTASEEDVKQMIKEYKEERLKKLLLEQGSAKFNKLNEGKEQ